MRASYGKRNPCAQEKSAYADNIYEENAPGIPCVCVFRQLQTDDAAGAAAYVVGIDCGISEGRNEHETEKNS